jgi:transposase
VSSQVTKYSEAFKLQVIQDVENGRFTSPGEAARAYGIPGKNTIYLWIRKYGKNHLLKKVVRVEKANEPGELKRLRERMRKLEALVADLSMDHALEQAAFEMVCKQQGIDSESFKKKVVANGLGKRSSRSKGSEELT